jgi:hydroxyacylglutathione hydrolase
VHVVTKPAPPFSGGALEIHQIPVWQDNLAWLLVTSAKEAAVVDSPEAGPVLAYARRIGVELTAIFNTHTHGDHIGINEELSNRGLRVVGPARGVPGLTQAVGDGDSIVLGEASGRVLLTEGHMDGHLSFVFGDVLFPGDTLFTGGCGYLFDGPAEKMFDSLGRLAALPGSTRVCCAHEYTRDNLTFAFMLEPHNDALARRMTDVAEKLARGGSAVPSTIAEERATNPFLRADSPELVDALARLLPGVPLASDLDVFRAARALKDTKRHRTLPPPPAFRGLRL